MARRDLENLSLSASFEHLRNDYTAARLNRFRRQRSGFLPLGSGADWHYRIQADYYRMMEYARDMDRNDAVVGQTIDRAVLNCVQDGYRYDPQTGDKGLDAEWKARWEAWTKDPQRCDLAGELSFWEMEILSLRNIFVDGDVLGLANKSGALEMVEAHRLRTPLNTKRNVIHGVLIDTDTRRRLEYWLTIADTPLMSNVEKVSEIRPYPTYDAKGNRVVFHAHTSKRVSQTRGVTALAPIFDVCGMFEDINFATLVQRQLVSCFAVFRERDVAFEAGSNSSSGIQTQDTLASGVTRVLQGVGPGMEIAGQPGERLRMDSPNVPNAEFFPHMKLVLTLIGVNLGLPLVMVLMDGSETNFSGWRGAIDQARLGFRMNQRRHANRWHRPINAWQVRRWIDEDPAVLRAIDRKQKIDPFRHRWNYPTWPYIQPLQDASADLLRLRNGLISWRRRAAERGIEPAVLRQEIIEDNAAMIEEAHRKAEELNKKYPGLSVTWREVASLPTPDGVKINVNAEGDSAGDDAPGAGKKTDGPAQRNPQRDRSQS
jgi:capsid protein